MNKTKKTNYIRVGVALGVTIGAALGVFFDNIAVGIGVGVALGLLIGALLNSRRIASRDDYAAGSSIRPEHTKNNCNRCSGRLPLPLLFRIHCVQRAGVDARHHSLR